MSDIRWPQKHPSSAEPFFWVLCSKDGTNDGGATTDSGELQTRTINSTVWTVPSGITKDSDDTAAVTIKAVSYGINTVVTITISGGTDKADYELTCVATLSDSSTIAKNFILPVRSKG